MTGIPFEKAKDVDCYFTITPIKLTVTLDMQPFNDAIDAFFKALEEAYRTMQNSTTTGVDPHD